MRLVMIFAVLTVVVDATVDAAPFRRHRRMPMVSTYYRPAPVQNYRTTSVTPSTPGPVVRPVSVSKSETPTVVTSDSAKPSTVSSVVVSPATVSKADSVTTTEIAAKAPETRTVQEPDPGNDALAEVNAARARRGLRPFQHDPMLTVAAQACAERRAAGRISGHLPSDFAYLPSGTSARAAGCGALNSSWGWGTCCTYENYTYAGAAWVMGSDGRRYMHLFVR
jgi:hypothetical protein